MTNTDHPNALFARGLPVYIIAGTAMLALLYAFRVVLLPFALALVLAAALRPAVQWLERLRLPAPAAAAAVVTAGILLVVVLGAALAVPAREWVSELPRTTAALERTVGGLRTKVDKFTSRLMSPAARRAVLGPSAPSSGSLSPEGASAGVIPATSATPSLEPYVGRVFGTTTAIVIGAVELSLLLFFMLAGGDGWDQRAAAAVGATVRGRGPVKVLERIRAAVSRYLALTLVINIGQGILVGLATWALGVPAPFLWGLLTVFAEFIPYIGGMAMLVLLALVGFSEEVPWTVAILPALAYLIITTIQNNVVSPLLYGRGLDLDPVAILMSVALWWFLWGVVGAFLAVPILATVQILCEESPRFHPIGVYLKGTAAKV